MKKFFNFRNSAFISLLIFSILGLIASFLLTIDKIHILKNPDFIPPCNINPILSCKSVMMTEYAEMFGFPNTLIGLIGYSVMITVAVFMLSGGKVNRLFMIFANLGGLFALIFSNVLLWISMYKIGALCPYCLLSYAAATNLFFSITLANLRDNVFMIKPKINEKVQKFISGGLFVPVIVLWHLIIFALILIEFPDVLKF